MNTQPKPAIPNSVKQIPANIIEKIGIKHVDSILHDRLRILVYLILIGMIVWSFWNDHDEIITLDDFNHPIHEGTLLYKTIDQLDGDTRQRYLKSLKKALDDNEPTKFEKYFNALRASLLAGILSEYMIHGSVTKTTGIVGKTILFTLLATTLS